HQRAAAIAIPSAAATTTPASTTVSEPTPIATIDSPSAMITISPNRPAEAGGISCQPPDQKRYGAPTSRTRASTQIAPWSHPSVNEAQISSVTPIAVLAPRPVTDRRRSGAAGPARAGGGG